MLNAASLLVGLSLAAPVPQPPPVPPELLRARLEAAEEGYKLSVEVLREGTGGSAEDVARWSLRVLEARRPLCKDRAEEAAAAQEHLERMKELEARAEKAVEAGLARRRDLTLARYYRAEAEILLFQIKGK
jgi:hypothetical protein